MKNNDEIRTYPSKGLIIFLSGVIAFAAIIIVLVAFLVDNIALKIILIIFCAIFVILSLIVLLFEGVNYLSLDETNKELIIHKFLNKKKILLTDVSRIETQEGFYIFFKGGKELYRIGVNTDGANTLIVHLERCGIKIKW